MVQAEVRSFKSMEFFLKAFNRKVTSTQIKKFFVGTPDVFANSKSGLEIDFFSNTPNVFSINFLKTYATAAFNSELSWQV